MELRRARSEEYAAIGRLTVAAYDPFLLGPEDFYRARLADTATRDAEAEVWVAAEADGIQILLVGLGREPALLPAPLREAFRQAGISVDAMTTGAAVRTYNVLLAEDRAVAAALVAVD